MENIKYTPLPPGHEQYTAEDKHKCPVYQQLQKDKGKKKDKFKKGGGCPFLPKEQKKNPPLEHYEFGFKMSFYTPYQDILSQRKGFTEEELNKKRLKVNTYPLYLIHTIFHNDEQTKKIRQIGDIGQKFFIQDEIREKGNKLFSKKAYLEAVDYYERALSLFKWLGLTKLILGKEKPGTNVGQIIESNKHQDEQFYENYKEYFSLILDENTELSEMLHDNDDHEKELRNSILMVLYQNLSSCYMKLKCFDLAMSSINDAIELAEDHCSINFFKKSQVIFWNKQSTIEELNEAKDLIDKALEIKKTEKLFKMGEFYLRSMSVQNANQIFLEQKEKIEEEIKRRKTVYREQIMIIAEKAREIQYINDVLGQDKNKKQNQQSDLKQEFKIIQLMKKRCYKKLEFYTQKQLKENIDYWIESQQYIIEIEFMMNDVLNINFQNEKNPIISEVFKELKIRNLNEEFFKLIKQQQLKIASNIYENAEFESELFSEALNQTFVDLRCLKEQRKAEQQQNNQPKKNSITNLFTKQNYLYQLAFILMIVGILYILYRNRMKTKHFPKKFK